MKPPEPGGPSAAGLLIACALAVFESTVPVWGWG